MMKTRLLTAAVVTVLLSAPTWAGDPGERRGQRLDYIFTQLELTEEQRAQTLDVLKTLRQERRSEFEARRQSGEGRPSREEMKALREAHQAELADRLNAVMTEAQADEFVTYLEAHRSHHHRGMRKHRRDKQDPFAESSESDAQYDE